MLPSPVDAWIQYVPTHVDIWITGLDSHMSLSVSISQKTLGLKEYITSYNSTIRWKIVWRLQNSMSSVPCKLSASDSIRSSPKLIKHNNCPSKAMLEMVMAPIFCRTLLVIIELGQKINSSLAWGDSRNIFLPLENILLTSSLRKWHTEFYVDEDTQTQKRRLLEPQLFMQYRVSHIPHSLSLLSYQSTE